MRKTVCSLAMAVCCALPATPALQAQQPAFAKNMRVLRYEESPGLYHVLYNCRAPRDQHETMPKLDPMDPTLEPAICWEVSAYKMVRGAGKFEPVSTSLERGILSISEHHIRFMPMDQARTVLYADLDPAKSSFKHDTGRNNAIIANETVLYEFNFMPFCTACAPGGKTPPTTRPEQLEAEYALVHESLVHFTDVSTRLHGLSTGVTVEVNAGNQPAADDAKETFTLYADLDRKLAEVCAEPARACYQSFAGYLDDCAADPASAGCQKAPECTASCTLTEDQSHALRAAYCLQSGEEVATAVPDLSGIATREYEAAKATKTAAAKDAPPAQKQYETLADGRKVEIVKIPSFGPPPRGFIHGVVDFIPTAKTTGPGHFEECSAKGSLARARLPEPRPEGGVIGSVFGNARPLQAGGPGAPPRQIAISAGVATSHILTQVQPAYPPVARAARVSGTVVLEATIEKDGSVAELKLVSGPPLLQQAALDAVAKWRYKPYLLNGEPVQVRTTVNVVFNLGTGAPPPTSGTAPAPRPGTAPAQP